jgi:TRAP-type C4-dicarboxylate transport system permease small subunit
MTLINDDYLLYYMDLVGILFNELSGITAGVVWALIIAIVIGEVVMRIAKYV